MSGFEYASILVPYNATPGAKRGWSAAIDLAKKTNGQITLITCIESQSFMSFFKKNGKDEFETEKQLVEKELEKMKHETKKLEKAIKHVIVKTSFAPDTIIEYAEKNKIDIVVIGQTKISPAERKYYQSTANYLLQGLSCPLLVVK